LQKIYGENKQESWPLDYVLSALQFFALDFDKQQDYIPPIFLNTLFHLGLGDFFSTKPLHVILSIYNDCIGVGQSWDEWIDDVYYEDKGFEALFTNLANMLDQLDFEKPLIHLQNEFACTQEQAINILKTLDLYEENSAPVFSAVDLLNEYSYGAYEHNIIR